MHRTINLGEVLVALLNSKTLQRRIIIAMDRGKEINKDQWKKKM